MESEVQAMFETRLQEAKEKPTYNEESFKEILKCDLRSQCNLFVQLMKAFCEKYMIVKQAEFDQSNMKGNSIKTLALLRTQQSYIRLYRSQLFQIEMDIQECFYKVKLWSEFLACENPIPGYVLPEF